jgi:hypothetical protein
MQRMQFEPMQEEAILIYKFPNNSDTKFVVIVSDTKSLNSFIFDSKAL